MTQQEVQRLQPHSAQHMQVHQKARYAYPVLRMKAWMNNAVHILQHTSVMIGHVPSACDKAPKQMHGMNKRMEFGGWPFLA